MRLPAEGAGNVKARGLTSSPGGCGRYRIRGDADASGNHVCVGRGAYVRGTRGICPAPAYARLRGRGAAHGAGQRPGVQGGPLRGVHDQGPCELAGLPAGPRSRPVRPLRPARGVPGPPGSQPAVPRTPGRPYRDGQHRARGHGAGGGGIRAGRGGGRRPGDRNPPAGQRVGDPRFPESGNACRARGSGGLGHRDLHRGHERDAVHPPQPAAGSGQPAAGGQPAGGGRPAAAASQRAAGGQRPAASGRRPPQRRAAPR